MGYRLRLHSEIRDWLTDLRGTEPELARRLGEAVVALLDTGERLGPPLVVAAWNAAALSAEVRPRTIARC
jgi:hypothetical protein